MPLDLIVVLAGIFTLLGFLVGCAWTEFNVCGPMREIMNNFCDIMKEHKEETDQADWWKET